MMKGLALRAVDFNLLTCLLQTQDNSICYSMSQTYFFQRLFVGKGDQ